jgi:threonine dehydrogenase-like Zn-dependent dehydrogenase
MECGVLPAPDLGPDDVLLKIDAAGVCGSDLHAFLGRDMRRKPGSVLGHEAVGRILDGAEADRRVVLIPSIACGKCVECGAARAHLCRNRQQVGVHRQGTLADLIAVPRANLVDVPAGLGTPDAVLAEPLAVAVHTVDRATRLSAVPVGEASVLVIGGGAIGLLCALVLKSRPCARMTISELVDARRETCRRAGIDAALAPELAVAAGPFDIVIDAVGIAQTRCTALDAVVPGGLIVHVGLGDGEGGIDFLRLTREEITVTGAVRASRSDFKDALALLAAGTLGRLNWVDRRPLADGPQAFSQLAHGAVGAAKLVLIP